MLNQLKEKAALYQSVFNTPNGKKVWKDLVAELNPDEILVKGCADETNVNIGKRAAFIYIDQLLRIDEHDG